MFTYGFARGFLRGRLDERFKEAAIKGWKGICNNAVDEDGNVYGVCCGSAYSFRADYYKYELPWLINDTHGTGIVLLAGVETAKLGEE
jgi:rhamnogalacturonyl hydrolase YesR